jgi:nucleotide-binding universal stress UspA family protein
MLKILVPADGSEPSQRAVEHLITSMSSYKDGADVHLINVQPPLPFGHRVSSVVGHGSIDDYHREEGQKALQPARQRLDAAGIKYHSHIAVGDPADVIVQYAKEHAVDQIVMGTHGHGRIATALMGSVAQKVLENAHVPVVLVK